MRVEVLFDKALRPKLGIARVVVYDVESVEEAEQEVREAYGDEIVVSGVKRLQG